MPAPARPVLTVLYVCTGNVCRSAAAEALLGRRAAGHPDVVVRSAGTGALAGYGTDAPTAVALAERGVPADGHVARWLDAEMVRDANLVLTATTEHRDRVLRMAPAKLRRIFTMREFARLGADVAPAPDPARGAATVLDVAARRGLVEPPPPGGDDIGDPFGAGLPVARQVVAEVAATVDVTARLLGLPAVG